MYNIRKIKHTDDTKIERTCQAVSYDKVVYDNFKDMKGPITKLMYRKPDSSIERYWVGKCPDGDLKYVDQVFVMNESGKTIERI